MMTSSHCVLGQTNHRAFQPSAFGGLGGRQLSSGALPARFTCRKSVKKAGRGRLAVVSAAQVDVSEEDKEKEDGRLYRRTVFTFDKWAKHRSTKRYWFNIKSIPASRIVRSLAPAIFWVGGVSFSVACYETALTDGLLPSYLPPLTLSSPQPQGLTSFALALLLVFRTNVSYGRWDEARKMWGLLLNRSRDLYRQALSFAPGEQGDAHEVCRRWICAFAYSLKAHLRADGNIETDLKDFLEPAELEALKAASHKPIFCMQMLSNVIADMDMTEMRRWQMNENVTTMEDILGGCERLLSTPVPLSYTRHTARFLLLWLTFLPFGVWQSCGWGMVVVNPIIAALLLAIEEIGLQIEEPFGILALEAICAKMQLNLEDLTDMDAQCQNLLDDKTMSVSNNHKVAVLAEK